MATSTRQDVREHMVDNFLLGRRGTNTGADQGQIQDDANFGGHRGAEGIEVGCSFMITSGTGAPADEITRLSSRPKLTTGVMNLDPVLTAALASGDTFELLFLSLVFDIGDGEHSVHEAIAEAQRAFPWQRRIVPITLAADGDMLASAETDWTLTNATDTKAAATFANAERVIVVTDSGSGGGYTATASIAVEENKSYYLEVTGFGTDAPDAGTLVLRDITNSADITLTESVIDRIEPEALINTVTMPSGCEQVSIRLTCTNASDVLSWANLIFRKNETREFTLADRPQIVGRIGRVFAFSASDWSVKGSLDDYEIAADIEQLDSGLFQITTHESVSGLSVWYEEYVVPSELTADSDTTTIIKEDLAAVAAQILLEPLQQDPAWQWRYRKAAKASAVVRVRFQDIQRVRKTSETLVLPYA